jgi:hypothetical protein
MRRRALSAVATLSWAALLACDSFDSGATPPAPADAGAGDGAMASGPRDSGGGGSDSGEASAPWCSGAQHELCEDFDQGPIGDPARWPIATNLGALSASSDNPKSAPRALRVSTTFNEPAYLAKRVSRAVSSVTCDLELRFDVLPKEGERMDLVRLQLGKGSDFFENFANIVLYISDTQLAWNTQYVSSDVEEGYVSDALGPRPSDASWHHVQITLNAHAIAVSVEGVGNGTREYPPLTNATDLAEIAIGAVSGTGGPWSALFDNIACDVAP